MIIIHRFMHRELAHKKSGLIRVFILIVLFISLRANSLWIYAIDSFSRIEQKLAWLYRSLHVCIEACMVVKLTMLVFYNEPSCWPVLCMSSYLVPLRICPYHSYSASGSLRLFQGPFHLTLLQDSYTGFFNIYEL